MAQFVLNLSGIREEFASLVKEDDENNRIAKYYNFLEKELVVNAFDREEDFEMEKKNLIKQGLTIIKEHEKEVNLNGKIWKSKIYTFQLPDNPTNANSQPLFDPLSMSIGYAISGLSYIKLLERKN